MDHMTKERIKCQRNKSYRKGFKAPRRCDNPNFVVFSNQSIETQTRFCYLLALFRACLSVLSLVYSSFGFRDELTYVLQVAFEPNTPSRGVYGRTLNGTVHSLVVHSMLWP